MKYQHYIIKRKIENVFIYPFIVLGRLIALIKPLKIEYDVFFLFPFYHTGGAEKVHALITHAVTNKKCIVYFTRKSVDDTFYNEFKKNGCTIKDISAFTDNKWLYYLNLIYRGIITSYINRQSIKPVVFNGQCNFAYKISPWVNSSIKQIELIHSFNTFSWIRIPFIPFIYKTIMISKVRIDNHLEQYKKLQIPEKYNYRIGYICNGIKLPKEKVDKIFEEKLNVLYVGRGTSEKRVHLVAAIAQQVKQVNATIEFTMVGDVENAIPVDLQKYCSLKGTIHDASVLSNLYKKAHIVIITSNTEGFPMVIMEAMSYGCAIIATPVGDLTVHIQQENGFITSSIEEDKVVKEMTQHILYLNEYRSILKTLSYENKKYANEHFDIQLFNTKYQELIFGIA